MADAVNTQEEFAGERRYLEFTVLVARNTDIMVTRLYSPIHAFFRGSERP